MLLCRNLLFIMTLLEAGSMLRAKDSMGPSRFYPFIEQQKVEQPDGIQAANTFVRPLAAQYDQSSTSDRYFLYPFGHEHREKNYSYWTYLFGLFSYTTRMKDAQRLRQGMFFPFFYFKRGFGKDDYTALWPLGGRVKNVLGKEQADWFLWPLWVRTKKQAETNYWFPWPLINYRKGSMAGLGIYPLGGHFYNAEQDQRHFLWPLIYAQEDRKNQRKIHGFLPFYAYEHSPKVKDLSIFWPFWGHRWEKDPSYEEHRLLWPLWVHGKGELRSVHRWAPFYTHSENKKTTLRKTWFFWPLVRIKDWQESGVDVHQEQCLYFLFWAQEQKNHFTQEFLCRKVHFWPIYSYWESADGHKQLQMLSPFEVFFPGNKMVRDIYSPLFNLYRYDEHHGVVQQSFLFNLFRERRAGSKDVWLKCGIFLDYARNPQERHLSILKGLFEYKKSTEAVSFKLFWIPLRRHKARMRDCKTL